MGWSGAVTAPAGGDDGLVRGIRWYGRHDVRLDREVADAPDPGPGRIRVDIEFCGICGTDVEEFESGPVILQGTPVLGHEFVGVVADVGDGVSGIRTGDRVALDGIDPCGHCDRCRGGRPQLCASAAVSGFTSQGGLAERITISAASAVVVPATVPADVAALAEPTSVGVRAVRRSRLAPGERVAVLGGGAIGLLAAQVARTAGAASVTVVDPAADRREAALALGADEAVAPGTAYDAADVVLDCTGRPEVPAAAIEHVAHGGRIVVVGLPTAPATIRWLPLVFREAELIGVAGHAHDEDFVVAVDHLVAGRVVTEPIVTHRIPLDRAVDDGIVAMAERRPGLRKVLVHP